ncbi:MAG TPA: TetR/AcrR family transcriptional regulator [Magnetospirillum sp.]|jgi:TetR/AcrR family transcriptional regulator of autoinduction and epiphytic fitness|nr:TetR/AcrR family transcriptional regulator [Magnetospirillum sp.]
MSNPCCPSRGDAKRQAVIDAAERIFLGQGYANASMDGIAAEAGVSKRTVYNHFTSKRDLFQAVVCRLYAGLNGAEGNRLPTDEPAETVLPRFAVQVLAHLRRPEITGLLRLIIAELPRFPELGPTFHAAGKGPAVALLENYLAAQNAKGSLNVPDAWLAAAQFLGAVKEGAFWPALLGLPVAEDERVINSAVAAFLLVHRPQEAG